MTNGVDRELGETDARLEAAEQKIAALEARQERMFEAFHMARGVMWTGGAVLALAGLIFGLLQTIARWKGAG